MFLRTEVVGKHGQPVYCDKCGCDVGKLNTFVIVDTIKRTLKCEPCSGVFRPTSTPIIIPEDMSLSTIISNCNNGTAIFQPSKKQ